MMKLKKNKKIEMHENNFLKNILINNILWCCYNI